MFIFVVGHTYRPQPPSGSCTDLRYRTISSLYPAGRGMFATWHVIRRPVQQEGNSSLGAGIQHCQAQAPFLLAPWVASHGISQGLWNMVKGGAAAAQLTPSSGPTEPTVMPGSYDTVWVKETPNTA
jgi:hypothetical protein